MILTGELAVLRDVFGEPQIQGHAVVSHVDFKRRSCVKPLCVNNDEGGVLARLLFPIAPRLGFFLFNKADFLDIVFAILRLFLRIFCFARRISLKSLLVFLLYFFDDRSGLLFWKSGFGPTKNFFVAQFFNRIANFVIKVIAKLLNSSGPCVRCQ